MKRRSTLPNTADDMMPMESTRSWWKRVIGSAINIVKTVMKRVLPVRMYTRLRRELLGVVDDGPGLDWERYCSLRRLRPIRPDSGWRSGLGVGRYYIDSFVAQHADDIKGRVLEVADRRYTTRFGADRVQQSDILHVKPGNPDATIIADLTDADHIPSHAFDCIILTQTLQYVFDPRPAIRTLKRILKPQGVLLVTVPGIAQITRWDMEQWGEYWRFTTLSAQRLFTEAFPQDCVRVESYGNVLSTIARLHGILATELRPEELDYKDQDYDVIISVRVVKPLDS
jgi:SAM-dependent methyltransferase